MRNSVAAALVASLGLYVVCGPTWAAQCGGAQMLASWYGTESGTRTANGERFDGTSMTAAHRTFPFGTTLRVTYRGKSVTVRINDRGPAAWTGRDLDLSKAAATKLGMIDVGVARVCAQHLGG